MTDQQTPVRGRFDMGAAYEALAYDYSQYPLKDRRTMLLHHLEQCIEPGPAAPAIPDRATTTLHLVMAGWLAFAGLLGLVLAPQLWWLELPSVVLAGYVLYRHFRAPHYRKENS